MFWGHISIEKWSRIFVSSDGNPIFGVLKMRFLRVFTHFTHPDNGVSVARNKNPRPLFNRNVPPKLTFHTSKSTFGHSKVVFRPS